MAQASGSIQRPKLRIDTTVADDPIGDFAGMGSGSSGSKQFGYEKSAKHMEAIKSTNWRANAHPNTVEPAVQASSDKTADGVKIAKRHARGSSMTSVGGTTSDAGSAASSYTVDSVPSSPGMATYVVPVHNASWSRISSAPYWKVEHGETNEIDEVTQELVDETVGRAYDVRRRSQGMARPIPLSSVSDGIGLGGVTMLDTASADFPRSRKMPDSAPANKTAFSIFELLALDTSSTGNNNTNTSITSMDYAACPPDYECSKEVASIRNATRNIKVRTLDGAVCEVIDRATATQAIGNTPRKFSGPCVVYQVLPSTIDFDDSEDEYDNERSNNNNNNNNNITDNKDVEHHDQPVFDAHNSVPAFGDPAILCARKVNADAGSSGPSADSKVRFRGLLNKLADSAREKFFKAVDEYRDAVTGAPRPVGTVQMDEAFGRFVAWVQTKYFEFFRSGGTDEMLRMLQHVDSELTSHVATSISNGLGGGKYRISHAHTSSTESDLNPKAREFLSQGDSPHKMFGRPSLHNVFPYEMETTPPLSDGSPAKYMLVPFPYALPGQHPMPQGLQPMPIGLPVTPPDVYGLSPEQQMASMQSMPPVMAMHHHAPSMAPVNLGPVPQLHDMQVSSHGLGINPEKKDKNSKKNDEVNSNMEDKSKTEDNHAMEANHEMEVKGEVEGHKNMTANNTDTNNDKITPQMPIHSAQPSANAPMLSPPGLDMPMVVPGPHMGLGHPMAPPPGFGFTPSPPSNFMSGIHNHHHNGMGPGPAPPLYTHAFGMAPPPPPPGYNMRLPPPGFNMPPPGSHNMGPMDPRMPSPPMPHGYAPHPAAMGPPNGMHPGMPLYPMQPNVAGNVSPTRPLPVRLQPVKPQGFSDTRSQMGYEAWIEHRKANDPEYALKCKQRQQRRYMRQIVGAPGGNQA